MACGLKASETDAKITKPTSEAPAVHTLKKIPKNKLASTSRLDFPQLFTNHGVLCDSRSRPLQVHSVSLFSIQLPSPLQAAERSAAAPSGHDGGPPQAVRHPSPQHPGQVAPSRGLRPEEPFEQKVSNSEHCYY